MNKNEAFFNLYQHVFRTYRDIHGHDEALTFITKLFSNALGPAYDQVGFSRGDINDFCQCVASRDESVGLKVNLKIVDENKIIYQFLDDPFPGLKGEVDSNDLERCYLDFKLKYLLGDSWSFQTTKHFWNGDNMNEHILTR